MFFLNVLRISFKELLMLSFFYGILLHCVNRNDFEFDRCKYAESRTYQHAYFSISNGRSKNAAPSAIHRNDEMYDCSENISHWFFIITEFTKLRFTY